MSRRAKLADHELLTGDQQLTLKHFWIFHKGKALQSACIGCFDLPSTNLQSRSSFVWGTVPREEYQDVAVFFSINFFHVTVFSMTSKAFLSSASCRFASQYRRNVIASGFVRVCWPSIEPCTDARANVRDEAIQWPCLSTRRNAVVRHSCCDEGPSVAV